MSRPREGDDGVSKGSSAEVASRRGFRAEGTEDRGGARHLTIFLAYAYF